MKNKRNQKQKTSPNDSGAKDEVVLELEARIEQQKEQLAQMQNSLARALADYENLQRRMQRDVEQLIFNRVIDISEDLISLKDNIDIALKENDRVNEGWVNGIIDIVSQIPRLLSELGISEINPQKGDIFNPDQHEAVMVNNGVNVNGKVIHETLQPGYILESKVIRPARVIVDMK